MEEWIRNISAEEESLRFVIPLLIAVTREGFILKRFMTVISFITFIALFTAQLFGFSLEEKREPSKAVSAFTYPFQIPPDIGQEPKHLEFLKDAATKNKVNILRTITEYDAETKTEYEKIYLYLSGATHFFDTIQITDGRALTEEDMDIDDLFLTTSRTDSPEQIGKIKNFNNSKNYTVFVLDKVTSEYTYHGYYQAECTSQQDFEHFLNDYSNAVNNAYGYSMTAEDYRLENPVESDYIQPAIVRYAPVLIAIFSLVILSFLLIYYILFHAKEISVMLMHGYSRHFILWKLFISPFIRNFIGSYLFIAVCFCFIAENTSKFIVQCSMVLFIVFLCLLTSLGILFYQYSKRIAITLCIKGKRPDKLIFKLNIFVKTLLSAVLILISAKLMDDLKNIDQMLSNLSGWEAVSGYGIFDPVYLGDDDKAFDYSFPLDIPAYELYPTLNSQFKAFYIDTDTYTLDNLRANSDVTYIKFITVNPNYLLQFPVYDETGQEIRISEDVAETVYLVPAQYRELEDYNKSYFQEERRAWHDDVHVGYYGQPEKPISKEIQIIYTKPDQFIFSINANVFPAQNNQIQDPIIQVMTEGNILVPDISYTSTGRHTLFIPLEDSDTQRTYQNLLPNLKKYKLDDNFLYLIKPYEAIMQKIAKLKTGYHLIEAIILAILFLICIILIQTIYIYFQRSKKEIVISKLFGYSYLQKYKRLFLSVGASNLLELLCCVFIPVNFLSILFLKLLIEWAVIVLSVAQNEKKSMVELLSKGDF